MPKYPDPGAFTATGLPFSNEAFRAYMLVMASGMTDDVTLSGLATAQKLAAAKETGGALLATALCAALPDAMTGLVRRRLGEETGNIAREFRRHAKTRFTYVDQAPADVQKLVLAFLTHGLEKTQAEGQKALERVYEAALGKVDAEVTFILPPNPRSYLLIADKLRTGTTGNSMLEDLLRSAVVEYYSFYNRYLQDAAQVPGIPEQVQSRLQQMLQADNATDYPDLVRTEITPDAQVAWKVLLHDTRVQPENMAGARIIGEFMSRAGDVKGETVAAAMLSAAIGVMTDDDLYFLGPWVGPETIRILGEHTQAVRENHGDIMRTSVPARQIALAHAGISVDQALRLGRVAGRALQNGGSADMAQGMLRPLDACLEIMDQVFGPIAGRMEAGALEQALIDKLAELQRMADHIRANIRGPQTEPPRPPRF